MAYRSFEDLEVWQTACRLSIEVYKVLDGCKDYGLKNQMTRAAVSIASNIAEGAERGSNPDFARFIHIAKGSAAELRTQLYIANRIGLVSSEDQKRLTKELNAVSGKLHRLSQSLQQVGSVNELPDSQYLTPEHKT